MAGTRLTRTESQARTRAALIRAGGEVFVERGFHGTSVEAIAERAGFTRGAFYSNFSSKEELFAELLQSTVYRAYREMGEAQLSSDGPIPTARETAETLAEIQAHPDGRWMFRLWLELLLEAGRDDVLITGGGIIPREDMDELQRQGVGRLFGPGTPTSELVDYIRAWFAEREQHAGPRGA